MRLSLVGSVNLLAVFGIYAGAKAEPLVDVHAFFEKQTRETGAGLARKTKPVDARPAKPGEIIVTMIKGEGKETQSPPAKLRDMVVRNRCEATGHEEMLVAADTFTKRYAASKPKERASDWRAYIPRGVPMRFVVIPANTAPFAFMAPWGEPMTALPGDVIVQEPGKRSNIYRIARAAFDCTYRVVRSPTSTAAPGRKP